jgi:hypothetical protein
LVTVEYSSALIRALHFMTTEHELDASPGLWRPGPIFVRNEATGDVVYEGPDNKLVPVLVNELVASLQDAPASCPAIVTGAMAHLSLVMIHPFRDGNGRMSRCLQTLVNARERVLTQELISIEEYLGRNTGSSSFETKRDYPTAPWLPSSMRRSACESATRVTAPNCATGTRRCRIRWLRLTSARWSTRLLRAHGRNRGAFYVATDGLVEVRNSVRGTRREIDTSRLFDPTR